MLVALAEMTAASRISDCLRVSFDVRKAASSQVRKDLS
jgi:hypothetical protein